MSRAEKEGEGWEGVVRETAEGERWSADRAILESTHLGIRGERRI